MAIRKTFLFKIDYPNVEFFNRLIKKLPFENLLSPLKTNPIFHKPTTDMSYSNNRTPVLRLISQEGKITPPRIAM